MRHIKSIFMFHLASPVFLLIDWLPQLLLSLPPIKSLEKMRRYQPGIRFPPTSGHAVRSVAPSDEIMDIWQSWQYCHISIIIWWQMTPSQFCLRISTWTRLVSSHSSDDLCVGPSPDVYVVWWLEEQASTVGWVRDIPVLVNSTRLKLGLD